MSNFVYIFHAAFFLILKHNFESPVKRRNFASIKLFKMPRSNETDASRIDLRTLQHSHRLKACSFRRILAAYVSRRPMNRWIFREFPAQSLHRLGELVWLVAAVARSVERFRRWSALPPVRTYTLQANLRRFTIAPQFYIFVIHECNSVCVCVCVQSGCKVKKKKNERKYT